MFSRIFKIQMNPDPLKTKEAIKSNNQLILLTWKRKMEIKESQMYDGNI